MNCLISFVISETFKSLYPDRGMPHVFRINSGVFFIQYIHTDADSVKRKY